MKALLGGLVSPEVAGPIVTAVVAVVGVLGRRLLGRRRHGGGRDNEPGDVSPPVGPADFTVDLATNDDWTGTVTAYNLTDRVVRRVWFSYADHPDGHLVRFINGHAPTAVSVDGHITAQVLLSPQTTGRAIFLCWSDASDNQRRMLVR